MGKQWVSEATGSQLLWITGHPGCGKTVLSRFLMDTIEDDLKARADSHPKLKLHFAYFSFDDKYETQRSPLALLRGLIHQLIRLTPNFIKHPMKDAFPSQGIEMVSSLGTLWNIFHSIMSDSGNTDGVYIIVDALDECGGQDTDDRKALLKYFQDYLQKCPTANLKDDDNSSPRKGTTDPRRLFLKLLVTSRPYQNIQDFMMDQILFTFMRLKTEKESQAHISQDLKSFISDSVQDLGRKRNYEPDLQRDVEYALMRRAGGMFLWVSLIIKDLYDTSIADVKSKILVIPKNLHQLYQQLLDNIKPEHARMAKEILAWVVCAPRPMTVEELAIAVMVSSDYKSSVCIEKARVDGFRQIKVCGPMLKLEVIERRDGTNITTVGLVHQSA
jgi:hypothetical protein